MNKRTFLTSQFWSVLILLFCGGATAADYANINSVGQGDFLFNSDTPNKYKVVSTMLPGYWLMSQVPWLELKSGNVLVTRVIKG
jgi:hypothetical protein